MPPFRCRRASPWALGLSLALAAAGCTSRPLGEAGVDGGDTWTRRSDGGSAVQTVFILMLENHNWSAIQGNASAPYLNGTLLPQASHAERYFNPPGIHPSLPNYLWLEAGTNFGIQDDREPSVHHQGTSRHLVALLKGAGISWKAYQEGIDGRSCPLTRQGLFAPKHLPMVYFDDVTGSNRPGSGECIAHVRPYAELAADLAANRLPRYVFITPDLCDDMHNSVGCASGDSVANGDAWLAREVPRILGSPAFQQGALFITWDESEGGDAPIGLILLSPFAKGHGYASQVPYTHSSLLRTVQELFDVGPYLGDAARATSLRDLFRVYP